MRENVLRFPPHSTSRLKASRQFNATPASLFIQLDVIDDVYAYLGFFAGTVFIAQADRILDDYLHYVEIDEYGFLARARAGPQSTVILAPLDRETPAGSYPRDKLMNIGVILGAYPRGLKETLCGRILLEVEKGLAAFRREVGMMRWQADGRGNHIVSDEMRLWIALVGGDPEEWSGWKWLQFLHPDDREAYEGRWHEALWAGKFYANQGRVNIAGIWLWMAVSGNPIFDSSGQIAAWDGFLHFEAVENRLTRAG
jgi:PAS domain-containing protein